MGKVLCDYCGRPAELVDSKVVYGGEGYGDIYLCRGCDAYVGVHKGTDRPLGRLANAELRKYKRAVHAQFDPIWKSGRMRRSDAYNWLAQKMGIPSSETHIGMFDVERCRQALQVIRSSKYAESSNSDGAACCRPRAETHAQ